MRREENKRRKQENAVKAEITQPVINIFIDSIISNHLFVIQIKNPKKLKRLAKKQMKQMKRIRKN